MTEQDERRCNTCLFYNAMDDLCELNKEQRHGYSGPCSQWEDWDDEVRTNGGGQ